MDLTTAMVTNKATVTHHSKMMFVLALMYPGFFFVYAVWLDEYVEHFKYDLKVQNDSFLSIQLKVSCALYASKLLFVFLVLSKYVHFFV